MDSAIDSLSRQQALLDAEAEVLPIPENAQTQPPLEVPDINLMATFVDRFEQRVESLNSFDRAPVNFPHAANPPFGKKSLTSIADGLRVVRLRAAS
jgi:hypothetical protein